MGIWFFVPFLIPLALQASTSYMSPHVSGTECVGFLKQDARGNLVVASLPANFLFSAFCLRFLLQTSFGLNKNHAFLNNKNPWTDTFLRDLALAKLRSTAQVWNHQRIFKLVNRLIVACQMTASLALLKAIVRTFLATNDLQRNSQCTHAIWHAPQSQSRRTSHLWATTSPTAQNRCGWDAIVGADYSASLSCDCKGQVHKEVLLWYCFHCIKKSISGTAFAHGFLIELDS